MSASSSVDSTTVLGNQLFAPPRHRRRARRPAGSVASPLPLPLPSVRSVGSRLGPDPNGSMPPWRSSRASCIPGRPRARRRSCPVRRGTTPATFSPWSTGPIPRPWRPCCPRASGSRTRIPARWRVIWADWQTCSDGFEELADPIRSQYKECFVVVRCTYAGRARTRGASTSGSTRTSRWRAVGSRDTRRSSDRSG